MTVSGPEQAWARAVFEALFPGCVPPGAAAFVRATVEALPPRGAVGLRAALVAVTVAPLWLERGGRLFPSLEREAQARVLATFAGSNVYAVRSMVTLLKATAAMACARLP